MVCWPSAGFKTSAKSVFAACSKKTLVSPRWLDASSQRGAFVPLLFSEAEAAPLGAAADEVAALGAVSGVANPLDGRTVHITDAFRKQHRSSKIVRALLTDGAALLARATMTGADEADFVFVADDHRSAPCEQPAPGTRSCFLSWDGFLQVYVPGHDGRARARWPW